MRVLNLKRKQLREAVKDVSELKELSKKEVNKSLARANKYHNRVKALNIVVAVETSIIGVGAGVGYLVYGLSKD